VRRNLHQLVTHTVTALAAVRENGVAHQDYGGPGFVLMADFIDAGVLDELSGIEHTVSLVKYLSASFHGSCTLRAALHRLGLADQAYQATTGVKSGFDLPPAADGREK
jgi:hypothetical protein